MPKVAEITTLVDECFLVRVDQNFLSGSPTLEKEAFFSIFLMNGPHSNGANVMHNCLQFVNEWQAPEQQRHSGTSWLRKRSPELLRQNGSPESGSQSCGAGSEMALLRWIVLLKS